MTRKTMHETANKIRAELISLSFKAKDKRDNLHKALCNACAYDLAQIRETQREALQSDMTSFVVKQLVSASL